MSVAEPTCTVVPLLRLHQRDSSKVRPTQRSHHNTLKRDTRSGDTMPRTDVRSIDTLAQSYVGKFAPKDHKVAACHETKAQVYRLMTLETSLELIKSAGVRKKPRSLQTICEPLETKPVSSMNDAWFQASLGDPLPRIHSPGSYQTQFVSNFVDAVSNAYPSKSQPTSSIPTYGSWLGLVAFRASSSAVLDFALQALSMSYLGRYNNDQTMIQNSRHQYGKSLSRLNIALQSSVEGFASETLCAVVLLSFYELLCCTAQGSWIQHAGGIGRLIQLRGPERHRAGLDKATFIACRNTLMIEAFSSGVPCFLDLPAWRALATEIYETDLKKSPSRNLIESFFSETVQYPGYVCDARLVQQHNNPYSVLLDLISRGHKHRSNLKSLYSHIGAAIKADGVEPFSCVPNPSDLIFPVVYRFYSVSIGSLYCAYWTFLTIINDTIIDLERHFSNCRRRVNMFMLRDFSDLEDIKTRHTEYLLENADNASNACRSAEDMAARPFLGSAFLFFALRAISKHIQSAEERIWIQAKLREINEKIDVSQFGRIDEVFEWAKDSNP